MPIKQKGGRMFNGFKVRIAQFVFIFCFFFYSNSLLALDNKKETFQAVYMRIATDLTYSNPEKALQLSDSIYKHSKVPREQVIALMLQVNVHTTQHDLKQAKNMAERAIRLARLEKEYIWEYRAHGLLYSIYASAGLYEEALQTLEKSERILKSIDSPSEKAQLEGLNETSRATVNLRVKNFQKAKEHALKSIEFFEKTEDVEIKYYHLASAYDILASAHYQSEDYEKSSKYYTKVFELLEINGNTSYPLYGIAYVGLAANGLKLGYPLEEVKYNLDHASKYIENNTHHFAKIFYYKQLQNYARKCNDFDQFLIVSDSLKAIETRGEDLEKLYFQNLIGGYATHIDDTSMKAKRYAYVSAVLLTILMLVVVLWILKGKQNAKKTRDLLNQIDDKKLNFTPSSKRENSLLVSDEIIKQIQKKLEEFEDKKLFLDPDVNLTYLLHFCNTNSKYFNLVLKDVKQVDFNTYINQLRVHYIVQKLKCDPKYRHFKIGALADESGFSSHTRFSKVFKEVTGISPSVFIRYI